MIKKIIDAYCRFLGYVIAALLAVMVILVFGNVFMRYAFNSGFSVSEELSRWLFVWLTFMGAVVALKDNGHLGTDILVGRLGPKGKRLCMGISLLLVMYCLGLVFKGSYDQSVINWDTTSAVMEISMSWFYGSGMVFAVLAAVIVLYELWRLLSGQIADADLMFIKESEEAPHSSSDTGAAVHGHPPH